MDFIATYWWLWLIGMLVCYGIAVYSQLQRMKRLQNSVFSKRMEDTQKEFTKGMGTMMLAGLAGAGFMIVLLLSIVLNVIIYIKAN